MNLLVLTTETIHHCYFIREIACRYPISKVIADRKVIKPKFNTFHPYQNDRNIYERATIFGGDDPQLKNFADTVFVDDINSSETGEILIKAKPDVIIVFGTRKISQEIINIYPRRFINLHGGDPEEYRGLDSHLWAVYHNDFSNIITTIHRVNPLLDDGDIILKEKVSLFRDMQLYQLRLANTATCIRLTLGSLALYDSLGDFISCPQIKKGRYYSFMPTELQEICVEKFRRYTKGIE